MVRSAALASMVEPSTPILLAFHPTVHGDEVQIPAEHFLVRSNARRLRVFDNHA
jgi:hypothetical protein